jgi:O-antigen ligase
VPRKTANGGKSDMALSYRQRRLLSILALVLGVVSVFVGLSQVAQGPNSALRFFEFTNQSEAVGFFANRNHFAALLYALTLLAAVWLAEAAATLNAERGRPDAAGTMAVAASLAVLVVILAAQAMARSRAGLALTIVALFGAFALALREQRNASGVTPAKLMAGALTLALMLGTQYALLRIAQRFADDPLQDARIVFARNTFELAKAFMPFGSGMGTFAEVYALFEKPQDALLDTYANRAHNDILELSLEAGVAGLGLMLIFIAWLVTRSVRVWARWDASLANIDASLARAATLLVALLIAHSVVDYPLRTGAMMAIMAFACGLLVEPLTAEEETPAPYRQGRPRPQSNHAESADVTVARSPSRPSAHQVEPQDARWGEDVQWPAEWRRGSRAPAPKRSPQGKPE